MCPERLLPTRVVQAFLKHRLGCAAHKHEGEPDKVIAAMTEALHYVGLIILGTDHDDRHHSSWHCQPQLLAKVMPWNAQSINQCTDPIINQLI